MECVPDSWCNFLDSTLVKKSVEPILSQLKIKRSKGVVYPEANQIFTAFELTPPESVRVVIVGQDPYHEPMQATGLAFAVPHGVKIPPSLRNIFREFADDLNTSIPEANLLEQWARNGVLLLNAILSVDAKVAGSHRKLGWERFTDMVIATISAKLNGVVFILWGAFAQGKSSLIDSKRHLIISSAHPSPLSAHRGFFGSRPFSKTEKYLHNWHWPRSLD